MVGSYGMCVFNCLRSCLFSKEAASFYIVLFMILNTVTVTLAFSATGCSSLSVSLGLAGHLSSGD